MKLRWPFYGKRGEDFNAITALHPMWDKVPTWQRHVIEKQAERIRRLEAERFQLRRGYERKIARLQAQLAQSERT